ncbi:4-hydroxy-tetrahydrodipicolinate synthase [Phreatobacter aquaticus]|uniref:4-hydroxy-tetrahydrodipicolinate synthase n=1 Tax=Phreatobacter aquaticus TaxID=2570229 RepID=A0A4D7QQ40_9HYPH|nr:4-hydroxy-tetrahydrodipicolinate synthase [Phreatobacter aquaticus]QCK87037.1 4-hydroxy-tetrahydrodipicolinate synthase [Phreatobacter aquaticus]
MSANPFKGSIPALVTPFKDGKVDEKAFRAHVDWVITEGSHGIVPVGTTGESPTLTHDEHKRVIEMAIDEARGRVPVIAGAGSNNTLDAIEFSQHAEKVGAQALLHVTPYYNKPSQEGLFQHFKAIAEATSLPIFIYNIPPRSVVDMSVETMARLAAIPNIVGVKDATAKLDRVSAQREACGADFIQLSGEDGTALAHMAHGGHGCISVTANVAPRLCAEFQNACMAGDYAKALKLQDKLFPLHQAVFLEPNPCPSKAALAMLGRMSDEVRLPMVGVTSQTRDALKKALVHAGLMN